jgi:hypothetical protein
LVRALRRERPVPLAYRVAEVDEARPVEVRAA